MKITAPSAPSAASSAPETAAPSGADGDAVAALAAPEAGPIETCSFPSLGRGAPTPAPDGSHASRSSAPNPQGGGVARNRLGGASIWPRRPPRAPNPAHRRRTLPERRLPAPYRGGRITNAPAHGRCARRDCSSPAASLDLCYILSPIPIQGAITNAASSSPISLMICARAGPARAASPPIGPIRRLDAEHVTVMRFACCRGPGRLAQTLAGP